MDMGSDWSFDDVQALEHSHEAGIGENRPDLGDYYSLLPEGDQDLGVLFQVPSTCGSSPLVELESNIPPASPNDVPDSTSSLTYPSPRIGQEDSYQERLAGCRSSDSASPQNLAATNKNPRTGPRVDRQVIKGSTRTKRVRELGRPQADGCACIIKTYLRQEKE